MVYRDICQTEIMTETPETFHRPEIVIITADNVSENPKTDVDMTYLENNNINKAIRKKLCKKDVYETHMHNIYNIILGQTNEQLWDKAAPDATFLSVKAGRDPIRYLMILKKLCFSNQYEKHPIRYICLAIRRLYNTIQHAR